MTVAPAKARSCAAGKSDCRPDVTLAKRQKLSGITHLAYRLSGLIEGNEHLHPLAHEEHGVLS